MKYRSPIVFLFVSLSLVTGLLAQPANLGQIEFPNSGSPDAQEAFLRGVLFLHSFEYEDAREAFQQAQKLDPDFAMAYWGEAMTYNHPLWREQDREAARKALQRLAPDASGRLAKAPTAREKDYLQTVERLYGEGDKVARDFEYAEAMRELRQKYPKDLEAASFYALAILGTAQGERDFRTYMKAASIVEEVFDKNPQHPGAAHYLIHSYDDPIHAPLGLRAARIYAKIAPAASHAQHMISHIFVALGNWEETVKANVKSYQVSVDRAKKKDLGVDGYNFHALHWLEYGLLQQGRYDEAREKLDWMEEFARKSQSARSRWYFAVMRAAFGVETRQWNELPPGLGTSGVGLSGVAADLFATGFSAAQGRKMISAEKALSLLRKEVSAARVAEPGSASGYQATTQSDIDAAAVLEKELAAKILLQQGKTEKALALLEEATAAEEELAYDFGPPKVVKPSHELYGEVLLELGRPAEAKAQFKESLERAPRRVLSLLGLGRAAEQMGDEETAREAYSEVKAIWHSSGRELPGSVDVTRKPSKKSTPF